jgi:hypothetical protein
MILLDAKNDSAQSEADTVARGWSDDGIDSRKGARKRSLRAQKYYARALESVSALRLTFGLTFAECLDCVVTPGAFAQEKLDHMRLLGGRLEIVPCESGRMTKALTRHMIKAAGLIAANTGAYWTDQLNNTDQLAAYHQMAEEIREQTGGRIDAFVQSVGTAASLRDISEALRTHNERIRIVAVEPSESAVLSGGPPGPTRSTVLVQDLLCPLQGRPR